MPAEDAAKNTDSSAAQRRTRDTQGGKARASAETVALAMAEVEKTLERLKSLRAERDASEARFKADRAEWEAARLELERQRDEHAERAERLSGQVSRLESEIATAEQSAAARARELEERVETGTRRVSELSAEIDELRRSLEQTAAASAASADEVEALRSRAEQLPGLEQQIEELRALSERVSEQHREARAELDAARGEIASLHDDQVRSAERIESQRAELEEANRRLEQTGEVMARVAELEASLEDAESRANSSDGERATLRSRADELEAAREDAERRASEAENAAQQERARAEELEASKNEADRRASEAEIAAQHSSARAEELEQQLTARGDAADSQSSELLALVEQAEQRAADAEARLVAVESELGDERARLESAAAETEQLDAKLDVAADRLVELQEQLQDRDRRLAEGGNADAELLAQLEQARSEIDQLRDELARRSDAPAGPRAPAAEWVVHRKSRLRKYRRAVRERTDGITETERLLSDRLKQCEDVLARRRELVEARSIIEQTHKKVAGGRARAGAGALVLFGTCFLTVLGLASWMVTDQLVPATYAASAVVEADFDGIAAGADEADEWQSFHETMLGDPQFMTRVAERMAGRGFDDLSTPGALKAKLEADLSWSSDRAGHLALELRGEGRERNARMLDALASTLVFESNALRQRRQDSAQTVIGQRVQSGTEPIIDPRIEYAAAGGGCAALFGFMLWFLIWRRMVHAKAAFEHSTQIDHLLEDTRWVDPIQQIIDARGEGAIGDRDAA